MQALVTGDMGFIGTHSFEAVREGGVLKFVTRPSTPPDEELAAPPTHTAHTAG